MGNNLKSLKATTSMAKDPELAKKLWDFSISLTQPQAQAQDQDQDQAQTQTQTQTQTHPQAQPNWYFTGCHSHIQD